MLPQISCGTSARPRDHTGAGAPRNEPRAQPSSGQQVNGLHCARPTHRPALGWQAGKGWRAAPGQLCQAAAVPSGMAQRPTQAPQGVTAKKRPLCHQIVRGTAGPSSPPAEGEMDCIARATHTFRPRSPPSAPGNQALVNHDRFIVRPSPFLRNSWPEPAVEEPHPDAGRLAGKAVGADVGLARREPRVLHLRLFCPERDRPLALRPAQELGVQPSGPPRVLLARGVAPAQAV
jgi:hypothetical protein